MKKNLLPFSFSLLAFLAVSAFGQAEKAAFALAKQTRGIAVVTGKDERAMALYVLELAQASELTIYFQSPDAATALAVRKAADGAGLLGQRVFVEQSQLDRICLGDNMADFATLFGPDVKDAEILRVLRPGGQANVGNRIITKPTSQKTDAWSHPFHGPDNNPQSTDAVARAPYLTQFIQAPKFSPMPQITVAAGGRVYRAFGHIAHKANQNEMLNTLICASAHNGIIHWKRKLTPGFMIHRNTMVATDDALYMADNESCKIIDAHTGKVREEIIIPKGVGDGPTWKWMAMVDGTLYALVGSREISVKTVPSGKPGLGHWPWGMWEGHDYKNPKTNFGYGRTFVAIDLKTKKIKWQHSEKEFIDARGVCLRDGKIYFYSPKKFLAAIGTNGKPAWRNSDQDLLEAIAPHARAQHYITGYATTAYIKCTKDEIFFSGPTRPNLVSAATKDGRLLWHKKGGGNVQLVLREEGIFAAGAQRSNGGMILEYKTGKVKSMMPWRRACTRATGSIDSVFFRASGGTVRMDVPSNTAQHIAPMRPPCQDGVIISDGNLFWGPWMCGCQLSLYGHISLTAAGNQLASPGEARPQFESSKGDLKNVRPLAAHKNDWSVYQGNNRRTSTTTLPLPAALKERWSFPAPTAALPTAPVTAGGLTFIANRSGVIRAMNSNGKLMWETFTGGAIYFPPAVAKGRVYSGSADGRVYCHEAATGRKLWSYRVAPTERWIAVFGKLISTWPVAGGVLVEDGTVYASAGIAHYDGTHVVALDAITGNLKWHNDSSGSLNKKVNSGVSMQGSLFMENGKLCFLGGGVQEVAQFNLDDGKCVNTPVNNPQSGYRTAFYPYYPEYGNYVSLAHTLADGRELVFDASYEGNKFNYLHALAALPPGAPKLTKERARWNARRGAPQRKVLWRDARGRRFAGFIVGKTRLLGVGDQGAEKDPFITLINLKTGNDEWTAKLPAQPIKGGASIDSAGRIWVTLVDGRVMCFEKGLE
ncbi:MAG: PQQ-binding-like beta-propeller repeat protein [Verrucomicrobia subdivision 3 bacterium]|nr:PQQ-binding-like beta-propeller repeat protein [Limisphaerales bacterium]